MFKHGLREMGIERPDATQKESRYNSAKMTHAAMCRDHLEGLFASRGLNAAVTLWKRSRHGATAMFPATRK